MDHIGPITTCVRDLAILLQAIAGPDLRDPNCVHLPVPDFSLLINQQESPPRLGRLRGLFQERASAEVIRMMDRVAELFRDTGAIVSDAALPPGFDGVLADHRMVMAVEAAAFHGERLRRHPDDYRPEIRKLIEEGLACPAAKYADAKNHQEQLRRDTATRLKNFDAFLASATTEPAPDIRTTGNPAFNSPWSFTGLPVVSIPSVHEVDGLPLAIQLVGAPWSEAELLAVAAWCEKALAVEQKLPPY
jgi:aspartyl-tRNA(Asn)/glutamyl-tRNA(Gln) amidotransferase subunit A